MPQVDVWTQKVNSRKGAVRAAVEKVGNDLRGRNGGLSCCHPQPSHHEDSSPEASQAENRHTSKLLSTSDRPEIKRAILVAVLTDYLLFPRVAEDKVCHLTWKIRLQWHKHTTERQQISYMSVWSNSKWKNTAQALIL